MTVTIHRQMRVIGFDRAVAAAHGFEVRTDASGREYAVPAGSTSDVVPLTTGVVYGNCGSSYITFTSIGSYKANLKTGFGVALSAVYYSWDASVAAMKGVTTYHWNGGLLFSNTWQSPVTTYYNGRAEYVFAAVSPNSYALLANGAKCWSGGPDAGDWIYY